MSYIPNVEAEAARDAFARSRVSTPATLFDVNLEYGKNDIFWEETLTAGGTSTHNINASSVTMSCTTASGDKVVRQTRTYHRYQPGKSQLVFMTFNMGATKANVRKRVGYFDAQNGIFLEDDGSGLSMVVRSFVSGSVVDTAVEQASWNMDVFDGSGTSGITLDISKVQILIIDLEWLGVGRVRVGFVIDGKIYYAHEFLQANVGTTVYMTTANLPLRYEIENTGVAADATDLIAICGSVISEGGFENPRAIGFTTNTGSTSVSVSTRRALVSIRPKQFFGGPSKVNRGQIVLKDFSIAAATNPCFWELVYKPTSITSASYSSVDYDSIAQKSTAGAAVTGGKVIASGYVTASAQARETVKRDIDVVLPLTMDSAGSNAIELALVATGVGGTSGVNASLNWIEVR